MGGTRRKLDIKAAAFATGIGLIIAGGAVALFLRIELRWLEVVFNLGVGIGTGLLYAVLAARTGTDLEIGHSAGGGALCAVLPMLLLWAALMDVTGALIGGVIAPALGAAGALAYEMRF